MKTHKRAAYSIALATLAAIVLAPSGAQAQPPAAAEPQADQKITPEARAVLDRVKAHFGSISRFGCAATTVLTIGQGDDVQKHVETASIAFERPNRVALRPVGNATPQYLLVCDGRMFTQYFGPPLNKYQSDDAPADVEGLRTAVSFGMPIEPENMISSPHTFLLALADGGGLESMLESAESIRLAGRMALNGVPCDQLSLSFARVTAEVWVRADGPPWVERIQPDLSKMFEGMPDVGEDLKAKMPRSKILFLEWSAPEQWPSDTFAFAAPEGSEKVASINDAIEAQFAAAAEKPGLDLLGKSAPDFALDLLGGGQARLEDHRAKDIVVLDFWATWCPLCVAGLPVIAGVAAEFKDKGVVFYAVNQQEEPATIREFLKQKKLDIPVALDADGKTAARYGVTGIPRTVLIGRDGTVQSVHVGFSTGVDRTLKRQLQDLVDGKPLVDAAAHAEAISPETGAAAEPMGAQQLWSVPGNWQAMATDPESGVTYAVSRGRLVRIDRDGKDLGSVALEAASEPVTFMRIANLQSGGPPEVLLFSTWGKAVSAFDEKGKLLWKTPVGDGIDDAWAADLDRDGTAEVIIGYNGSTGLHTLNSDGKRRWKDTTIGNVWHVTAAATGDEGAVEVLTTSAAGVVHVFDAAGKKIADLNPGGYANLVRVLPAGPDGAAVIVTSLDNGARVAGMDRSGHRLWMSDLGGEARTPISDAAVAPGRPWIAFATSNNGCLVLDGRSGKTLASLPESRSPGVSWIPGAEGKSPVLVTISNGNLVAVELK